jgi:hypothetical protein
VVDHPFAECPPTGPDRMRALREQIDDWIHSPALADLLQIYGHSVPQNTSLEQKLEWLEQFSSRWDFRGRSRAGSTPESQDSNGGARWLIGKSGLDPAAERQVHESMRRLGLVDTRPPRHDSFDWMVVIGGARLSNLLRTRHAAELVTKAGIRAEHVVLSAAARLVMDSERDASDLYAAGAASEFDQMCSAASSVLGLNHAGGGEKKSSAHHADYKANWKVWTFERDRSILEAPVTLLEAPSPDPGRRRANSADTLRFFASSLDVAAGARCLLVTSQIYVPYQYLEAVRALAIPYGLELEIVGFPPHWQRHIQGLQTTANYLQELRSTIQAAVRLYAGNLKQ